MKFLDFMEKRIDPFLKIELSDLAKTLADNADLNVEFAFHSYYKKGADLVTVSHYWNRLLDDRNIDGMKSDIYLRAYGNIHFTDYQVVNHYLSGIEKQRFPSFRKQLFALLEDERLEQTIIKDRPGMSPAFSSRRALFYNRFRERFTVHKKQAQWLDLLLCAAYLEKVDRPAVLPAFLQTIKPQIKSAVRAAQTAESTRDIVHVAETLISNLPNGIDDMTAAYFTMHEAAQVEETEKTTDTMEDTHELVSDSEETFDDDQEPHNESMPSWHQEQEQEGDNFLQFDLNEGSTTDLLGEGERQAEQGDQAYASVEGGAQDTNGQNYDNLDDLEQTATTEPGHQQGPMGEANRQAVAYYLSPERPTIDDIQAYSQLKAQVKPVQKPLQQSLKKTIEQKRIAPRSDLHFGRLGRKLLKIVTDDNPRLFYKKDEDNQELDVTFSLLVDCSASMHDKMAETKAGIVLFHDTLTSLNIPHAITGFWEDALSADDQGQPNYLSEVITFERSLLPNQGAKIMQLEPEEDNRDGYAIRLAAQSLERRPEKHKILFVFTDGEPSAYNYSDNGVVDTKEAVIAARRKGLEVIGVFLASNNAQESEQATMKHIYGRQNLIIPTVEDIPYYVTPLLKRVLLKYI
ncbi:vWA domain-containing protein [Tuberibacillus sp. Marseille-P3662]|uniref:vWA domain-containing protein n=1 Tax=Tuberibacillus sp. Marseille-P3662 TaxID=1965358 RepID=UPI001593E176|nr:hypothetical protein [Tuberibacillus sp. Marseille-P3662]